MFNLFNNYNGAKCNTYQTWNNNFICLKQLKLSNDMRSVWEQHVWWTREVIISIANSLPYTDQTVAQLLTNAQTMANVFAPYYSQMQVKQISDLFETHLEIGGAIVTAAKNSDSKQVETLEKEWYKNADDIAKYFASINRYYSESELKQMFYKHLEMTTQEALEIISGKYPQNIKTFNMIEAEALMMADYFTHGIVKQFPHYFVC